jgi:hypothetical protein
VLFGDSAPGVGVGVGDGVGVGLGDVPEVVKLQVGPLADTFAIVFPTIRQKYVVPGASVTGSVSDSVTPSSTDPVLRRCWPGPAPLWSVLASAISSGGFDDVPK